MVVYQLTVIIFSLLSKSGCILITTYFYRELISNGCDAITKLKKLDMIGEYEAPEDIEYKIDVKVSANNKTIKIIDNGIGMDF